MGLHRLGVVLLHYTRSYKLLKLHRLHLLRYFYWLWTSTKPMILLIAVLYTLFVNMLVLLPIRFLSLFSLVRLRARLLYEVNQGCLVVLVHLGVLNRAALFLLSCLQFYYLALNADYYGYIPQLVLLCHLVSYKSFHMPMMSNSWPPLLTSSTRSFLQFRHIYLTLAYPVTRVPVKCYLFSSNTLRVYIYMGMHWMWWILSNFWGSILTTLDLFLPQIAQLWKRYMHYMPVYKTLGLIWRLCYGLKPIHYLQFRKRHMVVNFGQLNRLPSV